MIENYKNFINEIKFDFSDEDWKDIEVIKIDQTERNGQFLNYEIEFLTNAGMVLSNDGKFASDRTNQYTVSIYKRAVFDKPYPNRKKDPYHLGYDCYVHIGGFGGYGTGNKISEQNFQRTTTRADRIKLLGRIMKELYLYMWEHKIDPDSIKQKETSSIKHKDIDPYNEEKWDDDNKDTPAPAPTAPRTHQNDNWWER
jgi:hypothetical protein